MILTTKSFADYKGKIEYLYNDRSVKDKSIFLNFSEKTAYYFHHTYICKFPFEFTGDIISNFYVDIPKFFGLCSSFENIEIIEDKEGLITFSNGEDTFKLFTFKDKEITFPPSFDITGMNRFTITKNVYSHFNNLRKFFGDKAEDRDYSGFILSKNAVVSANPYGFYQGTHDVEFPTLKVSSNIHVIMDEANNIYYKEGENVFILSMDDDKFFLISPVYEPLTIPPFETDEFRTRHSYPMTFTVDKNSLLDILEFFKVFVQDQRNQPLYITIEADNKLFIESRGDEPASRSIEITDCANEIIGRNLIMMRDVFLKSIDAIKDDYVKIGVNPDVSHPTINLVGDKTNSIRVLCILLTNN